MTPTIRALNRHDLACIRRHFGRHLAESGNNDRIFAPYAADDPDAPRGFNLEPLELALNEPGWQRWFGACVDEPRKIVGHVDLKGDKLKWGLHRCQLGIGIERLFRGQGLGRRLMEAALKFAREEPSIEWLDLRVFAHNAPARALYRRLGFVEIGTLEDRFRTGDGRIDDVIMALNVGS